VSRAARSCRNATSDMGPCGPVPSLLHRHLPATPWRPHRRAGRPVDRPASGCAGPPPRPCAPPCRRRRPPPPAGLPRPCAGDPGRAATPAPAPGPGNAVRGGPRNCHPRRRRGPPAAGRPRVCRPRPAGSAAADAGGRVRLRSGQRGGTAPGRHQDPGPPAPRPARGPAGVRLRQVQANTSKPTVCSDAHGRTLWAGAVRPGRMHDQTAVKTEGIADLLAQHPRSRSGSTRATGDWPPHSPSSSPPHPASRPKTPPPRRWLPGGKPAPSSPQHGSAWNMRSPSTSSGAPCSAITAAGSPSARLPGGRRPGLGPGSPTLIKGQPGRSGKRTPILIAHQVVRACADRQAAGDDAGTTPLW
jgi:hypothetical protein